MNAPAKVNYVRHLNAFFARVQEDDRLKSNHISLYLALFQHWNQQQFRQPFPVLRDAVIRLSGIGSANTYTRCLKDLHAFGYILYQPGGKQHPLCLIRIVYLVPARAAPSRFTQLALFEEYTVPGSINFATASDSSRKNATHPVANLIQTLSQNCDTYINNININKTEREETLPPIKKNNKANGADAAADVFSSRAPIAPDLPDVKAFFSANKYPSGEALKFYTITRQTAGNRPEKRPSATGRPPCISGYLTFTTKTPKMVAEDPNQHQPQDDSTRIPIKVIQTRYDYHRYLQIIEQRGQAIYGPKYTIHEIDRPVVLKLLCYFLQDEDVAPSEGIDLAKGLMLRGPVGCGKTSLMNIMRLLCPDEYRPVMVAARDVAMEFSRRGMTWY